MITVDPDGRVDLPEWPNTFLQRLALVVAFSFMAAVAVWSWGLGILVAAAAFSTPDGMPLVIDDGHPEFSDRTGSVRRGWALRRETGTRRFSNG
ncbi:MAG: hypothetical protein OXF88_22770 [Rhodobacteraceae bacterium]|nr:hypothetical protein [Paracoccaceae bacterium]MCY4140394.1 hypothetical protein [Paracoccaceae bacterium]